MSNIFIKDPNAVLEYTWNWSTWLLAGDTITTANVIAPTGITLDGSTNDTTSVTAWISGGTAGLDYEFTCRIITDQGRTDDRTITLKVRER